MHDLIPLNRLRGTPHYNHLARGDCWLFLVVLITAISSIGDQMVWVVAINSIDICRYLPDGRLPLFEKESG